MQRCTPTPIRTYRRRWATKQFTKGGMAPIRVIGLELSNRHAASGKPGASMRVMHMGFLMHCAAIHASPCR